MKIKMIQISRKGAKKTLYIFVTWCLSVEPLTVMILPNRQDIEMTEKK